MRKLYNEFFYIPKHGKVREKVMLTRVVMTVTTVIMCLVAMSITAYAYFSYNITSGSNVIKAANFEASVSITITDSNDDPITVTKDGKVQTANLEAGKYKIILTEGNSTAQKGFCVITIGDKTYYTDQIGVDVDKKLEHATVEFELRLSSPTKIEVLSHWGTSVYYGYKDEGRTEKFIVSGATVDLTTKMPSGESGGSGNNIAGGDTNSTEGTSTTPSTNITTGTGTPSTQTPESTTTPSTETTTPAETTPTEATGTGESINTTEPGATTETAPQTTEPTVTEPTDTTASAETQTSTENTETTDAADTEASE